MKLEKTENQLIGNWLAEGSKVIEDNISKRINWLIKNHLIKIATDKSEWLILYQDPEDGRYWELSYPQGHLQDGGPPSLINISKERAEMRFRF